VARLRFTESAERDLIEIGNFIARDNPTNAARFVERVEEHCQLLASYPLIGRVREELVPGCTVCPSVDMSSFIVRWMTGRKSSVFCTEPVICGAPCKKGEL